MKITHKDGKTDGRYSVTLEYTGQSKPQYVARFCGDAIGFFNLEARAWMACAEHKVLGGFAGVIIERVEA